MTDAAANSSRRRVWFAAALAMPIAIVTVLLAVVELAEVGGRPLLSDGGPRNVAEAAGMASASELLRLIDRGEDPSMLYDVRPAIISSAFTRVTALEAAVGTRRVELVQLLDRRGFLDAPGTRAHLTCLAADLEVDDIVTYLAPDGAAAAACQDGATLAAVSARGQHPRTS